MSDGDEVKKSEDGRGQPARSDHYFALPAGSRLMEYEIVSVLGHGGFGITYLARDTLLDEQVAIKEYLPNDVAVRTSDASVRAKSDGDRPDFQAGLKTFLDEARLVARFRHPNIVKVRRFFEQHGTGYIVLDFETGGTLARRLDAGQPSEADLRLWLDGILAGLETLHERAALHRDLKPNNVMLRDDGTPVLIDFGAARDFRGRRSRSITAIATPGYSPPEQYGVGGQQGPWTDLYALGAILYRAVTGLPPLDSLRRLRSDAMEPATRIAKGRYDPKLLRAIDWMLRIDETERPASVAQLRAALSGGRVPVADAPGAASSASALGGRRRWLAATAAAALLLALGYGGFEAVQRSDALAEEQAYNAAGEDRQRLQAYLDECRICAFRGEAEETLARLVRREAGQAGADGTGTLGTDETGQHGEQADGARALAAGESDAREAAGGETEPQSTPDGMASQDQTARSGEASQRGEATGNGEGTARLADAGSASDAEVAGVDPGAGEDGAAAESAAGPAAAEAAGDSAETPSREPVAPANEPEAGQDDGDPSEGRTSEVASGPGETDAGSAEERAPRATEPEMEAVRAEGHDGQGTAGGAVAAANTTETGGPAPFEDPQTGQQADESGQAMQTAGNEAASGASAIADGSPQATPDATTDDASAPSFGDAGSATEASGEETAARTEAQAGNEKEAGDTAPDDQPSEGEQAATRADQGAGKAEESRPDMDDPAAASDDASDQEAAETERQAARADVDAGSACRDAAAHWQAVSDRSDRSLYRQHLEWFGSCAFAGLALDALERMDAASGETARQRRDEGADPGGGDPEPQIDPARLASDIQNELKRAGCYPGRVDGIWGNQSRRAVSAFVRHAGLRLAGDDPSAEMLDAVRSRRGRICPLVCDARHVARGDRCVLKTCPSGQRLSNSGSCYAPNPQKSAGSRQKSAGSKTSGKGNSRKFCANVVKEYFRRGCSSKMNRTSSWANSTCSYLLQAYQGCS